MKPHIDIIFSFLESSGVASWLANIINLSINLAIIATVCWLAHWALKKIINFAVEKVILSKKEAWRTYLTDHKFVSRIAHIGPVLAIKYLVPVFFADSPNAVTIGEMLSGVYFISAFTAALMSALSITVDGLKHTKFGNKIHIKSIVQALKIVIMIASIILIMSVLFNKSPLYFFSGLGALAAVMMIVFKDSIMGLVASVQLSVNDMVEVGDWIEVPKHGADGDVIDINLTTVKVLNWDNTISTIPPYDLVSVSFKNWRSMSQRGGRRIKRAVNIDTGSIKFADDKLLGRISKIDVMQGFINKRLNEMEDYNVKNVKNKDMIVNKRHFTNIGLFRYYLDNYLRNHPQIHKNMTLLVRQLAPTSQGLPLEIYAFSSDTKWAVYEAIQSDIFDHIYAILPEFELTPFQEPAGSDIKQLSKLFPGPHSAGAGTLLNKAIADGNKNADETKKN